MLKSSVYSDQSVLEWMETANILGRNYNLYDHWKARMSTIVFTTKAKDFSEAVSWVFKGVAKNAKDIEFETLRLSLDKSTLQLTAYDGSSIYSSKIDVNRDVDSTESYQAVVPGGQIQQIASILKSGRSDKDDTTITYDNKTIVITNGRSKMTLHTVTVRRLELPETPAPVGLVNAGDFRTSVNQVFPATSTDDTIPSLSAILLEFYPQRKVIRLVACDRFQLGVKEISYDPVDVDVPSSEDGPAFSALINGRQLRKLVSGVHDADMLTVHTKVDGNGQFGISSTRLSGYVSTYVNDFVKYQALLKTALPHRMTIDRAQLKSAVSSIVSLGKPDQVVFLEIRNGSITVYNKDKDSNIEVDALTEGDVEVDFYFNPTYLTGVLNSAEAQVISWEFDSERKPVVVRNVRLDGNDETTWRHLIVPHRG